MNIRILEMLTVLIITIAVAGSAAWVLAELPGLTYLLHVPSTFFSNLGSHF